ncbi:TipJ family phage tail tip protein [Pasteurella sp. PK-2025]|uniref:TipJ family phage tail tip protein n=1 Tax=unclassified Pasteurella TaxID=2621516 RepID=UPI003C74460F
MGGDAGGGGHTPYEAPETGRSKQFVKIVEIISEGEIQGLVDGVKSVYLDKTPVQASDGSYNFKNVDAQGRIGVQDQDVMEGFNTSEKEVVVGTQVRKQTPLTRTITDSKVSRLRFTVGVQSLFSQNDQGDTHGTTVHFLLKIGDSTHPISINGKYSNQYLKQYEFGNLPPVPFTIQFERITEDSTSQRLQNNTIWASYTEIIETEFTYPNTAIVGVRFDSEYFGSIPNRTYEIYGIKLKVPSNYDPVNRTYTGLWDGTFKIAWSNNPAWVLYDLMTNKRYGLGQRLGAFNVDKWALYQVAQYCDQLVPDGFGGQEPRFTCNAWLTDQRKAYDVISDLCSIFRALPVWNGQEFTVVMDRPSDPVWTYTNANVINGEFSYQYSAQKSRHNEIHVEYVDANDSYERKIEVISDDDLIRRHGLNIKKITAFACTSRGQAFRMGKWMLETGRLETKTVTFTVGAEGLMHIPGDIIRVADCYYADTNIGGRVLSISENIVTLDREITIAGESYLTYVNQEAKHKDIRILSVNGNLVSLEFEPIGLEKYGVWSITTQKIDVQLFRALEINEEKDGQYTIVALQHEPQKEAIVDNGAVFEPKETSLLTAGLDKVQHVEVNSDGEGVSLSFDYVVKHSAMVKYQIKLYKNGSFYNIYDDLTTPHHKFISLPDGEYTAEIRAKNEDGQLSEAVTTTFNIRFAVSELSTVSKVFGILLQWKNPVFANPSSAIEIWTSKENRFETARKLVTLAYPTNSYSFDGLGVSETHYFWIRMIDTVNGNAGEFTESVIGTSESSGEKLVNYLQGQVTKNIFSQELAQEITQIETKAEDARNKVLIAESRLHHMMHGNENILKDSEFTRVSLWGGTNINIHDNSQRVGLRIVNKLTKKTTGSHAVGIITHQDNRVTNIEQGKQYTLSFYARGNFNSLNKMELKEKGTKWQALQAIPLSQEWEKKTITFTANWSSSEAGILIAAAPPNLRDWYEIHSVKLEKGTQSTDWSEFGDSALGDLRAEVSSTNSAIASIDGKLRATHTLKTEVTRGGKRAIAGIALGVGADAQNAESQVIISANKFAIADPNSATLKAPFVVVNEGGQSKVAIAGDLIANGSITGNMIQANASINAPVITGGSISGNSINGATVRGSVIEGGIIRGAHLEGATGKFTGELEVTKIVGGDIIEHVKGRLKRTGTYHDYYSYTIYGEDKDREESTTVELGIYTAKIHIRSSKVERYIYIGNNEISDILPANISKTYTLERRDKLITRSNDYSIASAPLDFLVMAYAVSSNATITVL